MMCEPTYQAVRDDGPFHYRAECECGWVAKRQTHIGLQKALQHHMRPFQTKRNRCKAPEVRFCPVCAKRGVA